LGKGQEFGRKNAIAAFTILESIYAAEKKIEKIVTCI